MIEQSTEQKLELLKLLEEKALRVKYNQIDTYFIDEGPYKRTGYPKALEFFKLGRTHMLRALVSANQTGKTTNGCIENVYHATGRYPEWWEGRKYDRPVVILIGADRGDTYRDSIQRKLLGAPGQEGTGLLPKDSIISTRPLQGTPGAVGQYFILHEPTGEISQIIVRTYQSERTAFEAIVADVVHLDEECPRPILSECLTRLASKKDGILYATFTPDSGLTDSVIFFLDGEDPKNKVVIQVTWEDVPHLTEETKSILLSSYSPHERDCRSRGIPYLGSGAIYPVPHDVVFEKPFALPLHWPRAYGLDVGRTRTAAVWGAYDELSDTWHLYSEHYLGQTMPSVHADAIKARGSWICGVVDPASHFSQYDGTTLYDQYRGLGLEIINANNKVTGDEGGIVAVYQRLASGRLKVFDNLLNWQHEFRIYRRDLNGKIVKENDHLMDATRYLVMSGHNVLSQEPDYDEHTEHKKNIRQTTPSSGNRITGY